MGYQRSGLQLRDNFDIKRYGTMITQS
jgi:hypothetical protein